MPKPIYIPNFQNPPSSSISLRRFSHRYIGENHHRRDLEMVVWSETSSSHMLYVTDDVISKTRSELVNTGELDETVLHQLEAIWKTKMIQAGLITGSIVRPPASVPTPTDLQAQDQKPLPEIADNNAEFPRSTNLSMDSVKREPDVLFIPQQDGANDEEDEDDELLSLDDDEEVAATDDDDTNIPHLVMCQFTKVKRTKNKWEAYLKSGVMQINGKNILFSEAKGDSRCNIEGKSILDFL